jgi:hypothetical protein
MAYLYVSICFQKCLPKNLQCEINVIKNIIHSGYSNNIMTAFFGNRWKQNGNTKYAILYVLHVRSKIFYI